MYRPYRREGPGRLSTRLARRASDVVDRIGSLIKKAPPRKEIVDLNAAILEVTALTRSEAVKTGARRACRVSLNRSTRRSPTAWEWASRSAARLSKPMVGGCGRPGASRGVLSFSLRSPLTEPPSVNLDLLGVGDDDAKEMVKTFKEICAVSLSTAGMSAKCQKRTSARLFDHLISSI
jgi:hypothetical protein